MSYLAMCWQGGHCSSWLIIICCKVQPDGALCPIWQRVGKGAVQQLAHYVVKVSLVEPLCPTWQRVGKGAVQQLAHYVVKVSLMGGTLC